MALRGTGDLSVGRDESDADDGVIQEFNQLSAEHQAALAPYRGDPDPGWNRVPTADRSR